MFRAPPNSRIIKRLINNDTVNEFKFGLDTKAWEDVLDSATVENKYNSFLRTFTSHFNRSYPTKNVKKKRLSRNIDYNLTGLITKLKQDLNAQKDRLRNTGSKK